MPQRRACPVNGASDSRGKRIAMSGNGRPRLQRSASERGTLQRSGSFLGMLGRVPWSTNDDDYYSSSGEEGGALPAPPSPLVSQEAAKVIDCFRCARNCTSYLLLFCCGGGLFGAPKILMYVCGIRQQQQQAACGITKVYEYR